MQIEEFATAWWVLTYSCNNRCSWCYAGSGLLSGKHLDPDLIDPTLSLISSLKFKKLILIGGEPTVYRKLEKVISCAKERGLNIGIVTNGRRISDRDYLLKLKQSGLDHLTISLEGASSQVHDLMSGIPGSFEEVRRGLDNCLEERIPVTTETTISEFNRDYLDELLKLLKTKGFKEAGFNVCTPCVYKEGDNVGLIAPHKAGKIVSDLYLSGKSIGIDVRLISPLPICTLDSGVAKEMLEKKLLNNVCMMFFGQNLVIDYNGDVLPCVHFSGYPLLNINKEGKTMTRDEFLSIYNKREGIPQRFREQLWVYPNERCIDDELFGTKCVGGCPIFWLKYDPREEIRGLEKCQV